MQRIDDNTYIDDTLVTCAEYQLFIDEMREQGKYYQPDHWTSYQFPSGKGREAILGVRHSDAVIFCAWLTDREASEWKYRLPFEFEAKKFDVEHRVRHSPIGYWIMAAENLDLFFTRDRVKVFFWLDRVDIGGNSILDLDSIIDRVDHLAAFRSAEEDIGLGSTYNWQIESDVNLLHDLERVIDRNPNRNLDLAWRLLSELAHLGSNYPYGREIRESLFIPSRV